jgi:hypothetical protein
MSSQEDRYEGHDTLAEHEGTGDSVVTDEQAERDSVFGRHQSLDSETTTDGEPVLLGQDDETSSSFDSGRPDDDRPFGFGHLTSSDPVIKKVSDDDSVSADDSVSDHDSSVEDSSIKDAESSDVTVVKDDETDDSDEVDDKDLDEDDKADAAAEADVTPVASTSTAVTDSAGTDAVVTDSAVTDSVVAGSSVTDEPVVVAPVTPVGATTPVGSTAAATDTAAATTSSASAAAEWLELQGKFVDDPAAAVREAGARVEQALADLRSKVETGSTEDLRTAFRRYRDLHATLR